MLPEAFRKRVNTSFSWTPGVSGTENAVAAVHGLRLIDVGLALDEFAYGSVDNQVAIAGDLEPAGAVEAHTDTRRVGAGREQEVVFEAAFRSVEHQIDAGVNGLAFHAGVVRDIAQPVRGIAALDVGRRSSGRRRGAPCRGGVRTLEFQSYHAVEGKAGGGKGDDGISYRRKILNRGISLSTIRLEMQWYGRGGPERQGQDQANKG